MNSCERRPPETVGGDKVVLGPLLHLLDSKRLRVTGILVLLLSLGCSSAPAQTPSTRANPALPASDKIKNGKRIFKAQGCDTCHGVAGQGGSQTGTRIAGPRISPPTQSFSAFASFIREPGAQMPAYNGAKISDADLAEVYAFLKFTGPNQKSAPSVAAFSAGNAQNGKTIYTSYGCYECHGRHAEGSVATGPRLSPLPVSLDGFISYVRHPAGDMPPYTVKVVSDSELADIYAFLQSLPQPPALDVIPLLQRDFRPAPPREAISVTSSKSFLSHWANGS